MRSTLRAGPSEPITFTLFRATDGRDLVKGFSVEADGSIRKASHAQFSAGIAWRKTLESGLRSLPEFIEQLEPSDCIATGIFDVEKARVIPRSSGAGEVPSTLPIRHRIKEAMRQPSPGLAMLDHDPSPNMPEPLRCTSATELMSLLAEAIPAFRGISWVGRGSSSQGVFNKATGQPYAISGGVHVYIVTDTPDLDTLRSDLEVALWRAGLGYVEFARNGRRLLRSVIDLSVLSPERLIFEAAPLLGPGVGRRAPEWERSHG